MSGARAATPQLRSREKIAVDIYDDSSFASSAVVNEIADHVRETGRKGEPLKTVNTRSLYAWYLHLMLKTHPCSEWPSWTQKCKPATCLVRCRGEMCVGFGDRFNPHEHLSGAC